MIVWFEVRITCGRRHNVTTTTTRTTTAALLNTRQPRKRNKVTSKKYKKTRNLGDDNVWQRGHCTIIMFFFVLFGLLPLLLQFWSHWFFSTKQNASFVMVCVWASQPHINQIYICEYCVTERGLILLTEKTCRIRTHSQQTHTHTPSNSLFLYSSSSSFVVVCFNLNRENPKGT